MNNIFLRCEKNKINFKNIFLILLVGSIFIDVLNGIFIQYEIKYLSNLGQLFRIITVLINVSIIFTFGTKKQKSFLAIIFLFFLLPFIYLFQHRTLTGFIMDESYMLKLMFPFIYIIAIKSLLDKRHLSMGTLDKFIYLYIIICPLTIIIPTLFGFGFSSYDLGGGYKGFYVSNNEINIVLVGCYLLSLVELYKFKSFLNIVLYIINLVALLLIGSKTSLLVIIFSIILFIYALIKKQKVNIKFLIFIILLIVIFSLFFYDFYVSIFNRFSYYYSTLVTDGGSFLNFLMSERNLRVIPAITSNIMNSNLGVLNFLFGIGRYQQVDPNILYTLIELDPVDTLLWYGCITCLFILLCYTYILLKGINNKSGKNNVIIYIYLLYMAFSITAGHVWYSPLSTTFLVLICIKLLYSFPIDQSKKVSIIIPVYNVEKYISNCINSILNQTYKNIELIIIDDGSVDSSLSICKKFEKIDERIKLFSKENGGLSDARNYGLSKVSGDIITFIDSDDTIDLNYVEDAVQIMNSERLDVIILPFVFEYPNFKKVQFDSNFINTFNSEKSICEILYANKFDTNVCGKFFQASMLDNFSFPKNMFYEDLFTLYTIMYKAKRIGLYCNSKYHYIQRSGSIMHTLDERVFQQIEAINNIKNFCIKNNLKKAYKAAKIRECMIKVDIINNLVKSKETFSLNKVKFSLKESILLFLNVHVKFKIKIKTIYVINIFRKWRCNYD